MQRRPANAGLPGRGHEKTELGFDVFVYTGKLFAKAFAFDQATAVAVALDIDRVIVCYMSPEQLPMAYRPSIGLFSASRTSKLSEIWMPPTTASRPGATLVA